MQDRKQHGELLIVLKEQNGHYVSTITKAFDFSKYVYTPQSSYINIFALSMVIGNVAIALAFNVRNNEINRLATTSTEEADKVLKKIADITKGSGAGLIVGLPAGIALLAIGANVLKDIYYAHQNDEELQYLLGKESNSLLYDFPCINGWKHSFSYNEDLNTISSICTSVHRSSYDMTLQDKNELLQYANTLRKSGLKVLDEINALEEHHQQQLSGQDSHRDL
jgi:hypothetical protein